MTAVSGRRARKQPAEVRREAVLDAAIQVFARQPYRAAGTAEIAREAGVAEPTIYRYYESKRELYLEALARSRTVVTDAFRSIAERTDDPAEALHAMGEWYEQMVMADPALLRLRQRAIAETDDEEVRARLREAYAEIVAIVEDVIRRGQAAGVFTSSLPAAAGAWMFIGVGQVLDMARLLGMTQDQSLRVCESMSDALARALSVEPG